MSKAIKTIKILEKGPKIRYQCDCACPKSTPIQLERNVKTLKDSKILGDIRIIMNP